MFTCSHVATQDGGQADPEAGRRIEVHRLGRRLHRSPKEHLQAAMNDEQNAARHLQQGDAEAEDRNEQS